MNNDVRHQGVIAFVEDDHVQVRIVQMAACAACKVASACHASEMKEKLIDVYHCRKRLSVGDEVTVVASTATAGRALMLGFGLPLLLMLVVLIAMQLLKAAEGATAIAMLASLIPYYLIIWMMRSRLARQLTFWIEETNK